MSSAETTPTADNANDHGTTSNNTCKQGVLPVMDFLMSHKQDALMWIARLSTMIFTVLYLIPIFNVNSYSCYHKALVSNAATSVLRLHQRIPKVEFSREFLSKLLLEDSCHYFFYTLIFLYTYPTTLVLLPVFLFALLHSTSFTLKLIQVLGFTWQWATNMMSAIVDQHSQSILRLVAFTEIFLMPLNVFMLFIGRGSILTPIIYYRFLTLRYQSKRNPYTRNVFHELRLSVEVLASQPGIPGGLRRLCHRLIALVSRLAPPVTSP